MMYTGGYRMIPTTQRGGRKSLYNLDPHFIFPPDMATSPKGQYKATCRHCHSLISASTHCKSNLITHLRLRHKLFPLNNQESAAAADLGLESGIALSVDHGSLVNGQQENSNSEPIRDVWTEADGRQIAATEAYISWLATEFRPLDTAESNSFKEFLNSLKTPWIPPAVHIVGLCIQDKAESIKRKIKRALLEVDSVSMSLVYKSIGSQTGIIVAACHYITEAFVPNTVVLGCRRVRGEDVSKQTKDYLDELEVEWSLAGKIDNILPTNMDTYRDILKFSLYNNDDNASHTAGETSNGCGDSCQRRDPFSSLPDRRPGFTEQLQERLHQAIRQLPADTRHALSRAGNLMDRARQPEQQLLNGLAGPSISLWTRQLRALRTFLPVASHVDALSAADAAALHEFVDVLQVFENFMVMLEEQPAASTGLIIPCLCEVHQALTDMSISHSRRLVDSLLANVKDLLDTYKQFTDLQYSCILDPRFKASLVDSQAVISLQRTGHTARSASPAAAAVIKTEPTVEPVSKKPRFFSSIKSPRSASSLSRNTSAIEVELQAYCEEPVEDEDVSPLTYWHSNKHRFPILSQLARRHLTLPTNTEHLVRLAGLHTDAVDAAAHYDGGGGSEFQNMMLIRCNKSLLL